MQLPVTTYASAVEWARLIKEARRRAASAGKRLALIVPSRSQALETKKALAYRDLGFGATVTTLADWTESLWSLFGDGRAPVTGDERTMIMAQIAGCGEESDGRDCAIENAPDTQDAQEATPSGSFAHGAHRAAAAPPLTQGMLDLLCRAAREALPFADNIAGLSENEAAVARTLQTYRNRLRALDKVEYSEMLCALMESDALQRYAPVVLAHPDAFTALEERFLEAANATFAIRALNEPDGEQRGAELNQLLRAVFNHAPDDDSVRATGCVRMSLASGPEAQRLSMQHAVETALDAGCATVNVVVPDPMAQFRFSAPLLQERGASCAVRCRKLFADTDAGRALLDVCEMCGPDQPDLALDADYAFNPFAGMWFGTAFFTDKTHRGNRLIDNSEVLTDLAGHAADDLQGVIGLVEEDDVLGAIEVLTRWAAAHLGRDAGYLSEQLAALGAAQRICETAQELGMSQRAAVAALNGASVPVNVETVEDEADRQGATAETDQSPQTHIETDAPLPAAPTIHGTPGATRPRVTFLTMHDAADRAPASVDAVVLGKLNAADYSLKQSDDSLSTLLAKWGLVEEPDLWGRTRREFYAVLQSARAMVALQRATHNETADEAQAAAVFEEVLSCYRADRAGKADLDPLLNVPKALAPYTALDGEEALVENETGCAPAAAQTIGAPAIGAITPEAQRYIVLPRVYKNGEYRGLDLSASQIESYLECPYQWFAKRRLKIETIDEQFSPVERGTFMHSIMEHFYGRFQLEVAPKVTADTLDDARAIMTEVFHEQAERQFADPKLKKGSRYVPVNMLEVKQRDRLLEQLLDYLEFETALLPAFAPWRMEWSYGDERPFSYAGCNLVGRIDRVDMDRAGNAVVIDYKSSLSNAYRLHLDPNGKEAKARAAEREKAREAYRSEHGGAEPPQQEEELELPSKMQVLIYAKAVRDVLNCRVVASIYLNPLTGTIQGAYDERAIGRDQLPFAKDADMRAAAVPYGHVQTFDQLIDECENVVAGRMRRLAQGEIAPAPHGKDACEYCPVGNCPKRLAKRKL